MTDWHFLPVLAPHTHDITLQGSSHRARAEQDTCCPVLGLEARMRESLPSFSRGGHMSFPCPFLIPSTFQLWQAGREPRKKLQTVGL